MIGYKVFDKDLYSLNGSIHYEIGKSYEMDKRPKVYKRGYHFYVTIDDCYIHNPVINMDSYRICKVEAYGDIDSVFDIYSTNKIKILEDIEITAEDIENKRNSDDSSLGVGNNGRYNIGDCNKGGSNVGRHNYGHANVGDYNKGCGNTGDENDGYNNTGTKNLGDSNTGNHNIGHYNTGGMNSGSYNSGYCNTGNGNTGEFNSGNDNTGDFNSGDRHSGIFNTKSNLTIMIFDKESTWTYADWFNSDARRILIRMPIIDTKFIYLPDMTKCDIKNNPEAKYTYGFLKRTVGNNINKQRQKWWDKLSEDDKKIVMSLPNFDAEKFYQCTGIRV